MAVSASAYGAHVIQALDDLLLRGPLLRKAGAELRRDAKLLHERLEHEVLYSEDAENQVLEDDRARRWLAELRRVLYRADDRLLQAYDAQDQQQRTTASVLSLPIMRRFTTDRYLKREISSLLTDIKSVVSKKRPPTLRRRETGTYQHEHRRSSSDDGQELVRYGSSLVEEEKIEMRILPLVDKLTEHQEPPRQFVIFAIYGLGGVGKTTVARKIFDDQRAQSAFSARSWVSISRASTVAQILHATCAAIGVPQVPKTKDELQALLADKIGGRRVFLVFNVHNSGGPSSHHHQGGSAEIFGNLVDVLKLFRAAGAAQGSRVLVTTTDENVGGEMRSAQIQRGAEGLGLQTDRLWQLPVEDAWALLLRAAGLERARVTPEMKKVGVAIVQRCNCLPLAVEAVGGVLRRKGYAQEEWERVRDSAAFGLKDPATGTQGGAGSSVYLSYQHAQPHLKQCFLYLSLFPADVEIERHLATQLWISEGFVGPGTRHGHSLEEGSSRHSSRRRNSMEETAEERGQNAILLRGSSSDGRHRTSSEIVADADDTEDTTSPSQRMRMKVVHPGRQPPRLSSSSGRHHSPKPTSLDDTPSHRSDQEVADWYLTELAETGLVQRTNRRDQYKMHDQVRKIAESLTENEVCAGDPRYAATTLPANLVRLSFLNRGLAALPEDVGRLKGLRTLLLSGNPLGESETDMDTICKNLGLLRVLDLSDTKIRSVPKTLGNLAYLRHLDLSRTGITAVHESIGRLRRLRFLGLHGCEHLTSLPRSIHKLLKLEHLDFRGSGVTKSARLHGLRHLTLLRGYVIDGVSASNGVLLEDLKNMSGLSDLQIDIREAVEGNITDHRMLKRKGSLRNLEVRCCTVNPEDLPAGERERLETMLTQLHPHWCLVSLKIDGYNGTAYPEWLCSSALPNLQRLSLENCGSCERLPPIWHLQKLRSLRMANLPKLREIDMRQPPAAAETASSFPNVEEMEIEDMEALEDWSDFQPGDLLHLRKLALRWCPSLRRLPGGLEHCKVISTMELRDAGLVEELANVPVQELVVEAMPNLTEVSNLPLMRVFTVRGCPRLERLSGVDSLQHVHVRDDDGRQLERLPAWLGGQQHFPRIETLDVEGGEELLARCERGKEDWHIVREIPRVYAYCSPDRLPYFSYARSSDFFCRHRAPGTGAADARKGGRGRLRSPEAEAGARRAESAASSGSGGKDGPPLGPAAAAPPADETRRRFWSRRPHPVDETYKKFLSVMSLFVVIVLWMITSLTDSHRNLLEDISLFCFYVCTVCYFIFLVMKRRQ